MPQVRAFIAIPLSATLVQAAQRLCRELAGHFPQVRWVRPQAMHLTLRFFAAIPEESLEKIGEVMLSVGRLHSPFQLPVAGIGAFPSSARPRVIWLGIPEGQILINLHAALAQKLAECGFPDDERSFSPHLTLGRCREAISGAGGILAQFRDVSCGNLEVDRLILYESRLEPAGAVHLPRKTVLLGC
jgi:2'-5' RNA ligase